MIPRVNALSGDARGAAVNPVAGDFSAAGRGLQQAGGGLQQLGDVIFRQNVQADLMKMRETEERFLTALDRNVADIDPLDDQFENQLETAINETIGQFGDQTNFRTGEVGERFRSRMEQLGEAQVRTSFRARDQAINQRALRQYSEDRQRLYANISEDPANAGLYLQEFTASVNEVYGNILDTNQLETLAAETAETSFVTQALGLAEQGDFKGARAVLDENRGDLDPAAFRSAKRSVRGIQERKRSEFLRATEGVVADLRIAASRASSPEEVQAVRDRIEDADRRGIFSGRQSSRAALTIALDQQQAAVQQQLAERADRLTRLASGAGAVDQSDADAMWEDYTAGLQVENGGKPLPLQQQIDAVADFAQQTGFVPSSIKQSMSRADRMMDEQQLAVAAQQYQTVRNIAPQVDTGLSEGSAVRQVAGLVEDGVFETHAEAATYLANLTPRDHNARKARLDAFDDEAGIDDLTEEQIAGRLDLNPLGTRFPGGRQVVDLPAGLRQDYVDTFRKNFAISGDLDAAQKATDGFFKERIGVSRIAGRDQAMMYPPERFVPQFDSLLQRPDVRTRLVQDDLEEAIAGANVEIAGDDEIAAAGIPRLSLQSDAQTERDIAESRPPTYRVYARQRGGGGALLPVNIIRRDGSIEPLRYSPPTTKQEVISSPAWREAVKREGERIEQMRQRRINREEGGVPDLKEKAAQNREAREQERRALDQGSRDVARDRVTEVLRSLPERLPTLDEEEMQRLEENVQPFAPPGVSGKMIVDFFRNLRSDIRERSEERTRGQ